MTPAQNSAAQGSVVVNESTKSATFAQPLSAFRRRERRQAAELAGHVKSQRKREKRAF